MAEDPAEDPRRAHRAPRRPAGAGRRPRSEARLPGGVRGASRRSRSGSPRSSSRRRAADGLGRRMADVPGGRSPTAHVRIYEVGPRDGLQNEATPIPTAAKLRFIELLVAAGLREIEATSFVSPRAIPQLADADELLPALPEVTGVRYPVLVPNLRGLSPGRGGRRGRAGRLHRHDRRVHRAQHRDDRRRLDRHLRAGPRAGRRARLVAPGLRLDRLRLPVHRPGRPGPRGRGGRRAARDRRRRGLLRRHDRGRRSRTRSPS